jgi:hypothetical protein
METVTVDVTIEELEIAGFIGELSADCRVTFNLYEGEKETRDYPGCDAEAEFVGYEILQVDDENGAVFAYAPGVMLDELDKVNWDNYAEEAFEVAADNHDSAMQHQADCRAERAMEEKLDF